MIDKDAQIAQIKANLKLLSAVQFLGPALMLICAAILPEYIPGITHGMKMLLVLVVSLMGLVEYAVIRFLVIAALRKRLDELENGNGPLL
jgi:hypothetical protein